MDARQSIEPAVDADIVRLKAQAVILIQSFWKGCNTRKKFAFRQLPEAQMIPYPTFLVGNDPKITGLEPYASVSGEKIALIGTSGLRSLALACELGNKETRPKLIIVDISKQVITFWRNLREMAIQDSSDNKDVFLEKFKAFLEQNKVLLRAIPAGHFAHLNTGAFKYENQDPLLFLSNVIEAFGVAYVREIIKNSVIIGQSWTDKTLFSSLSNILRFNGIHKIYMYPSNIVSCINDDQEKNDFFVNIQTMAPNLSIFTDLCETHWLPERFFLTTETNPAQLREALFPRPASGRRAAAAAKGGVFPQQRQINSLQVLPEMFRLYSLLFNQEVKQTQVNQFNPC